MLRSPPTALWGVVAVSGADLFLVAMGLLISAMQVRHRDIGLAMPVILQVWMFATPVLYPLNAGPTRLVAAALLPLCHESDGGDRRDFRGGVVLQQPPDLHALAVGSCVIALALPAAYIYFKFTELTMADVV